MSVVIIDYGAGNLHSVRKAFEYVLQEQKSALKVMVTDDPEIVKKADYIILPGVGSFPDCAAHLYRLEGMQEALTERVIKQSIPFLGICVGMQLMADFGYEAGGYKGLGWIAGEVQPIMLQDKGLKIPHMGWNTLCEHVEHPLLKNIVGHAVYFVHSFVMRPKHAEHIYANAFYGEELCAVVGYNNIIGTQFHPEKSQKIGLEFIHNFLTWCP